MLNVNFPHILTEARSASVAALEVLVGPFNSELIYLSLPKPFLEVQEVGNEEESVLPLLPTFFHLILFF
jgi:hypothetical protein